MTTPRSADDLVQLNARVPRGLRQRVAIEAARRGSTKEALVALALRDYLDRTSVKETT